MLASTDLKTYNLAMKTSRVDTINNGADSVLPRHNLHGIDIVVGMWVDDDSQCLY